MYMYIFICIFTNFHVNKQIWINSKMVFGLPSCSVAIYFGKLEKYMTLRAGFEPARGDPIGFQVQRLNHSAITA